uniref:Uncharacterized protein n=1 Tax=viral metagenome TaxID=1070528 RepID=A0A6H2A332_9ZZZZ
MAPGDRFKNWIEGLAESWKDRFRGWMASWLMNGVNDFLGSNEAESIDLAQEILNKIRDDPNTPQEIKDLINKLTAGTHPIPVIIIVIVAAFMIIPMITSVAQPLGRLLEYSQDKFFASYRFDPMSVITAWRRDPEKYAWLFNDLDDKGMSEERREALKFLTEVYPSPRDIVDFLAHEVFEPDMAAKYSLLSDWDGIDKEFAKKIGIEEDILKLYWMDHWKHPEWGTITELRHRDQIEDQDVRDWFRLVEIPEYWREKMLNVMWSMPNRIEIRMMARYLDLSKVEIEDLLKKAGLHEDYRSDSADFMMIMGLTGYWADMLSKGWMTAEEVESDIDSRGFNPVTAERLYKRLVKANQPEKVAEARDLTVAMIIRWVKLDEAGRRSQGVELLVDLNYTGEQAEFIMEGYLGDMGSPETFEDFKGLTQKYRQAIGASAKPVPEELIKAGKELVEVTKEVERLREAVEAEEKTLIEQEVLPEEATARRDELRVTLHRAEAELARIQTNYNALVAEWKHGE